MVFSWFSYADFESTKVRTQRYALQSLPICRAGKRTGQHAVSRHILNDGTQRMRCLLYFQMFGHVRSPGISVSLLPHVRRRPSGDSIEAYYSLAIKTEWHHSAQAILRNPSLLAARCHDSHALSPTYHPFAGGRISSPHPIGILEGRP